MSISCKAPPSNCFHPPTCPPAVPARRPATGRATKLNHFHCFVAWQTNALGGCSDIASRIGNGQDSDVKLNSPTESHPVWYLEDTVVYCVTGSASIGSAPPFGSIPVFQALRSASGSPTIDTTGYRTPGLLTVQRRSIESKP
jgi:hypothetical protein